LIYVIMLLLAWSIVAAFLWAEVNATPAPLLLPRTGYPLRKAKLNVQLGPRPYYLVNDMDDGPLKKKLASCSEGPFHTTAFTIAHRGAPLQFPEHTKEGLLAAIRMGAGILECDVAFTQDRQLVCRHSQCDLHMTTNILSQPDLAAKCTQPFIPADPVKGIPASAKCCTSDITLADFQTLCGKMEGNNINATTVDDFLRGTPPFRTDLYSSCGTLMTHQDHIAMVDGLGLHLQFSPELKAPEVAMPFQGSYTQEQYAQQLIDEYKAAGINPRRVWPQSFQLDDVLYWIKKEPEFGCQAVYLDARVDTPDGYANATSSLPGLVTQGLKVIAPPMFALVKTDAQNQIVPSEYAVAAKEAGLEIITWTFERSGFLNVGGGYYFQYVKNVIDNDGDMYSVLDVLAKQVGIRGIFTDWAATVTYYANCMGF
jgi:glycerophosphoryl diester phosphodiesterase